MQFCERRRRAAAEKPFRVEAVVCCELLVVPTVELEPARAPRELLSELATIVLPGRCVDIQEEQRCGDREGTRSRLALA